MSCTRLISCKWSVKKAVATLAMILFGLLVPLAGGGVAQQTTVRVEPGQQELSDIGHEFSVDVVVEGVVNLAGFQFAVDFDPKVLEVTAVEEGPFLGSSGREVLCGVKEKVEASAKLACVTLGPAVSLGGEPGADGTGILATLGFRATGKGEASLILQDAKLVQAEIDDAGYPIVIPIATEDGSVTVSSGGGFAWALWGPAIGAGALALIVVVTGLVGWRRLARRQ